jgi:hypothetical protein
MLNEKKFKHPVQISAPSMIDTAARARVGCLHWTPSVPGEVALLFGHPVGRLLGIKFQSPFEPVISLLEYFAFKIGGSIIVIMWTQQFPMVVLDISVGQSSRSQRGSHMLHNDNAMLAGHSAICFFKSPDRKGSIPVDFPACIEPMLRIIKLYIAELGESTIFVLELPVHRMRFQLTIATACEGDNQNRQCRKLCSLVPEFHRTTVTVRNEVINQDAGDSSVPSGSAQNFQLQMVLE